MYIVSIIKAIHLDSQLTGYGGFNLQFVRCKALLLDLLEGLNDTKVF